MHVRINDFTPLSQRYDTGGKDYYDSPSIKIPIPVITQIQASPGLIVPAKPKPTSRACGQKPPTATTAQDPL